MIDQKLIFPPYLPTYQFNLILLEIKWNSDGDADWANACDFDNHDLGSKRVESNKCGFTCSSTTGDNYFVISVKRKT